jgi:P-type Cu+ transporter
MTRDPVCGMDVEETPSTPKADHDGRTFYFCSESCRQRFEASPGDYPPAPGGGSEVH